MDDFLVVTDVRTNIGRLKEKPSSVPRKIQFPVEEESHGQIHFLGVLLVTAGDTISFKVYRKPTNKDNYAHYLSVHDTDEKWV